MASYNLSWRHWMNGLIECQFLVWLCVQCSLYAIRVDTAGGLCNCGVCTGLQNTSSCIIWSGSFSPIHTPQGGLHLKLFQCWGVWYSYTWWLHLKPAEKMFSSPTSELLCSPWPLWCLSSGWLWQHCIVPHHLKASFLSFSIILTTGVIQGFWLGQTWMQMCVIFYQHF